MPTAKQSSSNAQASAEATLEAMAGLYLVSRSHAASGVGVGSLSRFTALRSLYLRNAEHSTLCPTHPPLPTGLRHGARRCEHASP